MVLGFDLERVDRRQMIAILILLFLLTRLPFLTAVPFMRDEGVYSIMIEEQIEHPSIAVTFLGEQVGWKPPLMFWAYGAFVKFLRGLPIPIEAVYRLPSTLFGLTNAVLVFMIFERYRGERKLAFLGSLVYLTLFVGVHTDSRVLTDTLCGTFVFAGVLAYMKSTDDRRYLLIGGLLTFLAYFVKQANAATIPVIAAAFLLERDRSRLKDPVFLFSLLGFPIAMVLFNSSISAGVAGDSVFILKEYVLDNLDIMRIGSSLLTFFPLALVWFPLSIFGFAKNWKGHAMMSAWFALIVFPLISGNLMPFYFYPVMPAIAFFALEALARNENGDIKTDRFFYFVFILLALSGFIMGAVNHLSYWRDYMDEKEAGEFLSGKPDVLIIGEYAPGVFSYKMLEEKRAAGQWLDYGMVILPKTRLASQTFMSFINDYYSSPTGTEIYDGDFRLLFAKDAIFRKNTAIKSYGYLCIVGNESVGAGGKMVLNNSFTQIYNMQGSG